MRRLPIAVVVATLVVSLLPALPVTADVEHGTPNDPGFARCENDSAARTDGCNDNEQWDMYGPLRDHTCPPPQADDRLPCFAPLAQDPSHAAGLDFTGAWRRGNLGRDDVLVAYIEGGVNYSSDDIKDGLDAVFLNTGELPWPEHAGGHSYHRYDANRDGRVDIRDYVSDPRVNPRCGSYRPHIDVEGTTRSCMPKGRHHYLNTVNVADKPTAYLSPEDLIAVFGHCRIRHHRVARCRPHGRYDNDHNGYPNDVSGWNTYRNNNDPQTEDLAYNHAPGLVSLIGGQADNHYAGVGACTRCRVVPIRQGAECLGRTDKEVEALNYAVDIGADVVSSVVVNYTYSKYDQIAVDWAWKHGVLLSLDSNDFDAMDHTNGMYLDHAIPGNSLAEDKGGPAAGETRWYRARSNVTSYGTHNVFSYGEYTTSGATPFGASTLAMVVSAGLNAVDKGVIPSRLRPDEVKQILMDTADPVIPQTQTDPQTASTQWPGNPDSATDATHTNWSTQYGYGRPDVGKATAMVMAGKIPPHAEITAPRWFAYVDPFRRASLPVRGVVARSRVHSGGKAHYVLEWALGADPKDADFHRITSGHVRRASGTLGTVDLTDPAIRAYAAKAPGTTLQPDGAEQYTLTVRLRVWDDNGVKAEDRRSVGVRHDPTLAHGFPVNLHRGEVANTATADIEGRRQLDLVVATNNGDLHVFRPNGSEIPGFPVHSDRLRAVDRTNPQNYSSFTYTHSAALRDQRDPLSGGVAVGDLFHDGRLEIVATSAEGDLYGWDSHGRRLRGFPFYMRAPFAKSPTPRAATAHSRLPARGNWSPPVLAPLEGGHRLDILMTGYDGRVYAFRPTGRRVPGWPVKVQLPRPTRKKLGSSYVRDPKLMYPVTVARLPHHRHPVVFVPSFESNGADTSTENLGAALAGLPPFDDQVAQTWLYAIWPNGRRHKGDAYLPNWPVTVDAGSFAYDQSIDFVGEATSPPVVARIDGATHILTAPITGLVEDFAPDGTLRRKFDASCGSADCGNPPTYRVPDSHTIELSGIPGLGDLDGDGTPEFIANNTGVESIVTSLDAPGVANLPQVYEKAWNVSDGSTLAGFPVRVDGFPFYSSPTTASVDEQAGRAAVEGNDTYWVHAFHADGSEADGFPKYTGQWMSFSSTVWDPRMNGHVHLVDPTREGFLYDWRTDGRTALNDSWWTYRHDEWRTGDYATDSRRPAALTDLAIHGGTVTWTASGDDYMVGRAKRYVVRWSTHPIDIDAFGSAHSLATPRPAVARTPQSVSLPASVVAHRPLYVAARAVDDAGNLGALVVVCRGCGTRHGGGLSLPAGWPPVAAGLLLLALLAVRRRRPWLRARPRPA